MPVSTQPPAGGGGAPNVENPPNVAQAGTGNEPVASKVRRSLAARVSKLEYKHSVLDVLGVELESAELDAAAGGLPDDQGDGVFKHFADKQTSTEQHVLAYFDTAHTVAERADLQLLNATSSCTQPTSECGAELVTRVGRRLFRRALDERETSNYAAVFDAALEEGAEYEEAARWVVAALLQAPSFLFHMEGEISGSPGLERDLTNTELAARLASFLWVSVPDETLLSAAEAGELSDESKLQLQVERMLKDPKAHRLTEAFITDFSRARLAAFEGVTDEQRQALHESVLATFQYHLWEKQRSVAELFTTTEFVLNPITAELLGLTLPSSELQVVDVAQLPERKGLLTHPGMIAGMGDRDVGSFVNRGKYLLERLLCRNPAAFPPEIQQELEQFNRDTTGLNEHERFALRKERAECWSCHMQFEPFALGFSRFDGAGRYVGEIDAAGKPLSLDGWVPTSNEARSPHYSNIAEYMDILATDSVIQTCMTEHFLSFATARTTDNLAKAQAKQIGADYIAQGSTLSAMVSAVVKSTMFRRLEVSSSGAEP